MEGGSHLGKPTEFPMGPPHHPDPSDGLKHLVLREHGTIPAPPGEDRFMIRRDRWTDYDTEEEQDAAFERIDWELGSYVIDICKREKAIVLEYLDSLGNDRQVRKEHEKLLKNERQCKA